MSKARRADQVPMFDARHGAPGGDLTKIKSGPESRGKSPIPLQIGRCDPSLFEAGFVRSPAIGDTAGSATSCRVLRRASGAAGIHHPAGRHR